MIMGDEVHAVGIRLRYPIVRGRFLMLISPESLL